MAPKRGARAPKRGHVDELEKLRQRNAELELELRKQRDTTTESADKPVDSAADAGLKPRTSGQHFKIRGWEMERMGRAVGTSPDEVAASTLAIKADAVGEEATSSALVQVATPMQALRPVTVNSQLGSAVRHWIVQARLIQTSLGGASPCSVHEQLLSMRSDLTGTSSGAATTRLMVVYDKHLQDLDRPHLALSAAIPGLFNMLNDTEQTAGSDAFSRCASLVRHLVQSSRFGRAPPLRRPDDVARPMYVRELCVQVGLCMDLVRLGFVHKKHLKSKKNSGKSGGPTLVDAMFEGPSAEEVKECVDREEIRDCLALAGKYLAAVQMDMDRHHDEVSELYRRARANAERAIVELPEEPEPEEEDDMEDAALTTLNESSSRSQYLLPLSEVANGVEVDEVGDMALVPQSFGVGNAEWEQALATALTEKQAAQASTSKQDQVLALIAAATDSKTDAGDSQALVPAVGFVATAEAPEGSRAASPAATADPGAMDPLLTPSFGEFLDQQLLPLYVADVPFETLRHLVESYCGIPLDSDDEHKAWKVLGMTMPQRTSTKRATRKEPVRSRQSSPGAASSTTTASSPLAGAGPSPTLASLCVSTKSSMGPPMMRQQMTTSIVEKRKQEIRAPRNMDTSVFRVSGRSRSAKSLMDWPAASPIIKPSHALWQSPAPGSIMRLATKGLGATPGPAPSPISMRKNSRGRIELQSSVRSVMGQRSVRTSRGRSRSPVHRRQFETPQIEKKRPTQPDWHLLDSPGGM